jgi:hypothetical protein
MDSIEAHRVKTVPGNPLMMRRAEEETANQCSNTKESTGAPVSASEQDSLTMRVILSPRSVRCCLLQCCSVAPALVPFWCTLLVPS